MKKYCLMFLVITGFSALPPLHQSTREIQALISDSQLLEYLGSAEPIESILRTKSGFLVLTHNYAMNVYVHYIANRQFVGPAQFQLEFQLPIDVRTGEIKSL